MSSLETPGCEQFMQHHSVGPTFCQIEQVSHKPKDSKGLIFIKTFTDPTDPMNCLFVCGTRGIAGSSIKLGDLDVSCVQIT